MNTTVEYIRKYWFGIEDKNDMADIVLLMERDRIEQYKAALEYTTHSFEGVFKGITGYYRKKRLSVIYSIGPAHIVDCVNFLCQSFLIEQIFATGSVGGLMADMGDIIISNHVITQDSYSLNAFYDKIQFDKKLGMFINIEISPIIEISDYNLTDIESFFKCHIQTGRLFTIPCVSMENKNTLEYIKDKGVIAIDLESGPFIASCLKNNINAICIHWVTDLPLERDFYYKYYGDKAIVKKDYEKKHKQWLNMPSLILPVLDNILNKKDYILNEK